MEKAYVDGFENFFDAPTMFSGLSGFASSSDSLTRVVRTRAVRGLRVAPHLLCTSSMPSATGIRFQPPADATVPLRGGCRNRSWASAPRSAASDLDVLRASVSPLSRVGRPRGSQLYEAAVRWMRHD